MVGDSGRGNTAEFDQLAAGDTRVFGDVFIDLQAGPVAEGLSDFFDLDQIQFKADYLREKDLWEHVT